MWTAEALLRAETETEPGEREDLSYEGYRKLRAAAPRVLNAFVLAEIALRVAPEVALASSIPEPDENPGAPKTSPEARAAEGVPALAALLAELPAETKSSVVKHDFDRIERALELLERWWDALDTDGTEAVIVRNMVRSRFFSVLMDESALLRFGLEVRLLAELFPDQAARAEILRERLQDLGERARRRLLELFRRRGDAAWASLLHAPVQTAQELRSASGGKRAP